MAMDISALMPDNNKTDDVLKSTKRKSTDNDMTMDKFFALIAVQLANQDVLNPQDNSEMMQQMVQMAVIQAMSTMTDTSVTSYSASLVGKEVTLGVQNEATGDIEEIVGTVTGSGLYKGEQVIFVNDKAYYLTQIMAVGRLPEVKDPDGTDDPAGDGGDSETPGVDPDAPTEGTDGTTDNTDKTEGAGGASQPSDETDTPNNVENSQQSQGDNLENGNTQTPSTEAGADVGNTNTNETLPDAEEGENNENINPSQETNGTDL